MQTVNSQFELLATADVRPTSQALRISFDKQFDDSITFFTLDTSLLDGIDILASQESNVIAEWDKYEYVSYSDRVVSTEWQREVVFPYSVTQAIADVTLNNYDDYFTKDAASPIDEYLLPQRPMRILAGFGGNDIPQFVGLTSTTPVVDTVDKTVSVHCTDFLTFIFNTPLDQTLVFQDYTTSEVLAELFTAVGLSSSQYQLDEAYNTIAFVYFEKGMKLGDAARKLMQAELGSLYMDEAGIIRFKNRLNFQTTPVYSFDESTIVDFQTSQDSEIINVVEIKSAVRVVQSEQPIYNLIQPLALAGAAPELFVSFDDPVVALGTIQAFTANTAEDGSGTDVTSSLTVTTVDLFNTAAKITFANAYGGTIYLRSLAISGQPAKVARNIYLRMQDDASVAKYEQQVHQIENEFIQDNDGATSLALSILRLYSEYSAGIEIEVKGNPALQLGDKISVTYKGETNNYIITKIQNSRTNAQFKQRLSARRLQEYTLFTLDESVLDGTDVLAL